MRYVCAFAAAWMVFLAPGQPPTGLSINNYQLVSETRVTRTVSDLEYRADLVNPGAARALIVASATSKSPSVGEVRQGNLRFVNVPATGRATSANTFVLRVDRTQPFNWNDLEWAYAAPTAPVANAGPAQTVALRTNVRLDGSGSTNPPGSGTLTYAWELVTRPEGSTAALTGANTMNPAFIADVHGTYVARLTVTNLASSNSSTVTISTVNSAPVANAGPNQTAAVGTTVQLSGASSSDVDGDPLTYRWTMASRPAGSNAALSSTTVVNPTFRIDRPGSYSVQLIVNDGKVDSQLATVNISTVNSAPVANAGAAQTVSVNSVVQLDGSGSTDVDGDPITYTWSFNSRPEGSNAALSSTTVVNPTFRVDRPGTYVVQLIVNDGTLPSAPATVTISTSAIQAPTANPGNARTVKQGTTVNLTGGGTDPQNLPLTYSWSLLSRPTNSTAALSSATAQNPTFVVDRTGDYVAQLIVNNGFLASAPQTVTITTTGSAPIAVPGANQTVFMRDTVRLDGSGSSDPDGDPITFSWTLSSRPANSTAALQAANSATPSFVPDLAGSYVVQLIVNDGYNNSTPVTMTVTVNRPKPVANAGAAQTVDINSTVQLNGSSSTSIDNAALTYTWTVQSAPTGSTATLTNPAQVNPTFRPDRQGAFTIRLVVNDGTLASDPATVVITTNNAQPPVANAGGAQSAFTGTVVTLNGNASNDPQGLPLTYAWTLTQRPTGSGAALVNATSVAPTFVPDRPGSYVASLRVNNSYLDSQAATVTITVTDRGQINLPSAAVVELGQSAPFPVSLTTAAPAGGVTVSLASADTARMTISPATVTIAEGATTPTTQPAITGLRPGPTAISATALSYTSASANARTNATLTLTPGNSTIEGTGTRNLTATLSGPAPAGGLTLNVTSSNTSAATVPATVTIAAGATTAAVPVTGAAVSSLNAQSVIRVSATDVPEASATVTVNRLDIIVPTQVIAALGEFTPYPVQLARPAVETVFVQLTSSDPSRVTTNIQNVVFNQGQTTPISQPTIRALNSGAAIITASATGMNSAVTQVQVGLGLSFAQASYTAAANAGAQNVLLRLSGPAPSGGVEVMLNSSNPAAATVPATAVIGAASNSVSIPVTMVAPGLTVITATSSVAGQAQTSFTVQAPPSIVLPPSQAIAFGQTANLPLTLSAPAPAGGVTVNVASANPGLATVSPNTVSFAAGETQPLVTPQVTGVNFGNATIQAQASGFGQAQLTLQVGAQLAFLQQSMTLSAGNQQLAQLTFSVSGPSTGVGVNLTSSNPAVATVPSSLNIGQNAMGVQVPVSALSVGTTIITATANAPNIPAATLSVTVQAAGSSGAITLPSNAAVAVGQSAPFNISLTAPAGSGGVTVALASANANVVTVSPSQVTISAGQTTPTTQPQVTGVGVGTANINATAQGYANAAAPVQVNTAGALAFASSNLSVTVGQTNTLTLNLPGNAPAGGLTVNMSSNNAAAATVPATVTIPGGTNSVNVTVSGVALGSAVITASHPSYTPATANVTVGAGIGITLPSNFRVAPGESKQFPITLASPATAPTTVALQSSDTNRFTFSAANVFINTGQTAPASQPMVTGVGAGAGTATVSGTGLITTTAQVTVGFTMALTPAPLAITGTATQQMTLTLSAPTANAMQVALTSGNTAVATVPAAVNIAAGAVSVSFPVTGVAPGSSTITAAIAGIPDATATVNVSAASVIGVPATLSTQIDKTAIFNITLPSPAGPGGVTVSLSSSHPERAVPAPASVFIPEGAVSPSAQPRVRGVNVGAAVISASASGYVTGTGTVEVGLTVSWQESTLSMNPSTNRLNFLVLGASAPAAGVTINFTSSNPAVAAVRDSVTVYADGSSFTTAAVNITAGANPGSATITASGLNIPPVSFTVNVGGATLAIQTTAMPNGQVGVPYSLTLAAAGGTSPYTWSITGGGLPSGMNLTAATGLVSGTPLVAANAAPVTFRVADASNPQQSATVTLNLTVATNGSGGGGGTGTMALTPNPLLVTAGSTGNLTVTLSAAAPSGGVTVNLSSTNTAAATVPASVNVAAGATTATVPVAGVAAGQTTVNASATGYASTSATVNVSNPAGTSDFVLPVNLRVAPGQQLPFPVTLAQPAASATFVTLQISDPTKASLSTAGFLIPAGATAPAAQPNITGIALGNITITASASGLNNATANVAVGFGMAFNPNTLSITGAATANLNLVLAAPTQGQLQVTLQSSNPAVATVSGFTLIQPGGQTLQIPVTGVTPGTVTITASAPDYPSATATVTIQSPGTLSVGAVTIPLGETRPLNVTLTSPAPAGGLTVNLASGDTTKVTVPASVTIPAGATAPVAQPNAVGVNVGSATITASAAGFTAGSATATVGATVNWTSSNPAVTVGNTEAVNLQLSANAPSAGVTVQLSSANTGVATVPATATFVPGTNTLAINVTGVAPGTSVITASGVNIPAVNITVTVNAALTITTASLPAGTVGTAYSATLAASGGRSPYTWALSGGTLPAGLQLSDGGVLSGTATAAASNVALTFRVTDASAVPQVVTKVLNLTINAQTPASIAATSGTPQSVAVNAAFNALVVTVRDAANNPVPNVTVTFAAPASGASATFAGGVNTATTNAQGVATSAIPTANATLGAYQVTASVAGLASTATFSLTNTAGAAASITATAGTGQSAAVGTAFAANLQATVRDASNNPVANVTVTFTVPASGASGSFLNNVNTATTNASGVASLGIMANNTVGAFQVTATANGVTTPATFSLTNTAGAAASVAVHAGNNQGAVTNGPFANPLAVIVRDAGSNPVAGVTVTFAAPLTGASASFAGGITTAVTGANGVATSPALTANASTGSYSVTATIPNVNTPATFTLTNTAGGPASITISAGNNQTATVGAAFTTPLAVLVRDASNNPVSGATVTFATPTSGASANFASGNTAITNSSGIATAPALTANSTAGSYSVSASVEGVTAVTFSLTNAAGMPASITATGGQTQSTSIGTAFGQPLAVTVRDSGNNPVSGVTVTFTAPASGATGAFAGGVNTAVTNASGVATSAAFTANNTMGAYTVQAAVSGLGASATFNLTNAAGAPAAVAVAGGSPQSATIGATFAQPLSVTVVDAASNPVSGVTVTFNVPASGARGSFAGGVNTAVTNASGVATSVAFAANNAAGTYSVTATVTGVAAPATFLLTNVAGPAAAITATGGSGQAAGVGSAFALPLRATVTDAGGNPIAGVTVTFTAPTAGASGSFAGNVNTANTDANGVAVSTAFTANTVIGSYSVTASAPGINSPASFALTNNGGPPASITVVDGSDQTAFVGTAFGTRLQARVRDSGNNPVANAAVTFALPSGGAGGNFDQGIHTVFTNSAGIATASLLTANALPGGFSVSASVPGVPSSATFGLTNLPIVGGSSNAILIGSTTVGQNLQTPLALSIPFNAPQGGLQITLTSSNGSLVRMAGRLNDAGVQTLTVRIPQGLSTLTGVFVHGMAASGTATITARASGLDDGVATITLSPSGFVLSGPNGLGVQNLATGTGAASQMTITAARLDASLRFAEVQQVRGGTTVTVPMSLAPTTGLGSLSSSNVSIAGGASSATLNFTAGAPTSAAGTITANPPSGYSTPANNQHQMTVNIFAGSLITSPVAVGRDLQASTNIRLSAPAGPAGVQVTLTSADASKVRFSLNPNNAGATNGILTFTIPAGRTVSQDVWVQALSAAGPVTYQVSATGFSPVTGTVSLSPSGIFLVTAGGPGGDFFAVVGGLDAAVTARPARLDTDLSPVEVQVVRGGFSLSVAVTSSAPAVGTIVTSPVVIAGNSNYADTLFRALTAGTSTVRAVQPSGFTAPSFGDVVTAYAQLPGISIDDNVMLGNKLQHMGTISLGRQAGPGGVQVTLTSSSSSVLISATPNGMGSSSVTVTVPQGSFTASYYLQGMADSGSVMYTATAAGFGPKEAWVENYPSTVIIVNPIMAGFPLALNAGGAPGTAEVRVGIMDPWSQTWMQSQPVAGGQTLTVAVSNTAPSVATAPASVVFAAGEYAKTLSITPVAAGSTVLSINTPAGLTPPLSGTSVNVNVN